MSIIESIRNYMINYSGLTTNAPVWVNFLGNDPTQYSIVPLAGSRIIEKYLDGGSLREFPFAFQSMESTADNLERLESIGFYEAFSDWLDSQTEAGTLPTLASGKTPTLIEALGCGYLYQEGESSTGIYSIQCRLEYIQT